jgi:lipopolysaccharide export system permease protein
VWRLNRYLFAEVTFSGMGAVGVFVFILITGNAMKDIVGLLAEGRIPLGLFFHLIGLLLPFAVSFALPMGMLIGILAVMGRLSANHELTAMRSAGISLWRVARPVLLVALLGTVIASWINAWYAPQARSTYKAVINDLVRTDPVRFIVPRTFIHDFPGYVLYAGEREAGQLRNFWLWELDDQRRAVRLLRADEGAFSFDEDRDSLVLTLRNGFTELRDASNPDDVQQLQPSLLFRDARIRLPLDRLLGDANRPRTLDMLSAPALWQKHSAAQALASVTDDPALRQSLAAQAAEAIYHLSRRLALGCAVFSLCLLGVPLGLRASRTETYANAALALALSLAYYVALVLIGWTADKPALHPELLVWLPNLVCHAIGWPLIARANHGVRG